MAVVHWTREANVGPTIVTTHCGRTGRRCRVRGLWADQYAMAGGPRFKSLPSASTATCKKCLKAAEAERRNGS